MGGAKIKPYSIRSIFSISHFHQSTLPTWYRLRGVRGRQPPVYMQLSDTPRGSASLVPATLAHPNKVIGLYQGSEDQTLQYQEHILDLTFSPVNPAHLISPAGVQGAAAPCLHTALKHSQGQRSACPCRCGAPQQGDRDCIGDRRSNPAVPRSPLPTGYRLAGVQGAASPCLHTSLSHSPGRRSACPCRCEKSKNEIGTGWGGAEIKSCSIRRMFRISHFHQSTLPTRYRQQGSGDANPLTASNPETFPGAAQRYPLPLWRTPKWR